MAMGGNIHKGQIPSQHMQNQHANRGSPGVGQGGMVNGQMQNNAAMLAAMQNASNMPNGAGGNVNATPQNHGAHYANHTNMNANASASPMPPPSTPVSQPQQLSSGHVPAITQLKHNLQAQNPHASPQQIDQLVNGEMRKHLHAQQARQNAVNAAAGNHAVMPGNSNGNYNQNQVAFQQNNVQTPTQSGSAQYNNQGQAPNMTNATNTSPQQAQYSAMMRQRLMQQQAQMQPAVGNAGGSPTLQQLSPSTMHASPNMAQVVPNMAPMNGQSGRPPSRSATPQMARLPSNSGMTSPGLPQGSPRSTMVRQ